MRLRRHGSRGGVGEGVLTPPPWNFQNIHLGEQHFKFFGIIRGTFVYIFQNFQARLARLLLYLIKMEVQKECIFMSCHYHSNIWLLSWNLKVILASLKYDFCICKEQKKKHCFFLLVFYDHYQDITSFCQTFCYKILVNYLKFKGSETKHSFTRLI